ncbi:MFS transporter [Pseudoxanthomonas beigongshangi]
MPSRFLLPVLAMAVFFVGASEFMLSAMLSPLAAAFAVSPARAAWLVSGYALTYALAAPVFGYLSDRMERRRWLLASLLLLTADNLALTLAPNFGAALGLRMLGGLASAALIPTAFALVADAIPARRQSTAMGAVMAGMTFGIVAGPALAGVLTQSLGWRTPFWVIAVGCMLTLGAARAAIPRSPPAPSVPRSKAVRWLGQRGLVRLLLAKGLWNGTAVAGFLLAGEVLRLRHGLGVANVGLSVSVFGGGLLLGNLGIGAARRLFAGDEAVLMAALWLLLLAMGAFMAAPLTLPAALACLSLWGFALGLAAPASTALLAHRSGPDKGQVLAVSESFNNGVLLIVLPIAATQLEFSGTWQAMLVLGAPLLGALGLLLAKRRSASRRCVDCGS